MKSRKGVLLLLAAMLTVALGMSACSSGGGNKQGTEAQQSGKQPQESNAAGKKEKVSIRLATAMDPARLEPYKKVVDQWNADHPDVEVNLENTAYSEYWKKIQVMTASNTLPDVWVSTPGLGSQWLENDQLLPLNEYIDQDSSLQLDDYHKMMIDYMTYNGQIYGFPYDVSAQVLFYNKDLFDEAKLAYPTNDWTLDDVRNAAKQLSEMKSDKGKIYGLLALMSGDFTGDSYWRAFGATTITPEGKVGVNNEGGIEALQFFKENIDMGITPKPEPGKSTRPIWLNGQAGMMADGGWAIPSFKDVPFAWDMVKIPGGPKGQYTTGLGGVFVISKMTKHPKEAYEFLKYLTSPDSLNEIITKADAGVPGRLSSQEGLTPVMKKYADLISTATPYLAINGTLELQDIVGKELEQVWFGTKSPQDALQTIEEQGNKLLEEKKKK